MHLFSGNRLIKSLSAIAFILAFANVANATPVDWTLQNLTYSDGTNSVTLLGTFTFDADATRVVTTRGGPVTITGFVTASNLSFTTSYGASGILPSAPPGLNPKGLDFINGTTATPNYIAFSFLTSASAVAQLTNAGGTLDGLSGSSIRFSKDGNLAFTRLDYRSGSITSNPTVLPPSAVPVPAAAWLFGSGLMGLVAFKRRKEA